MKPPAERLHALDAVRAFALLAGIALHATVPWLANLSEFHFGEKPSATAAAIYYFLHIFRMPVFFVIAGYFGRLVTERRGTKGFVKDRTKRIAIPLVVGIIVIPLLTVAAFALGSLASGMSIADLRALAETQLAQQTLSVHYGTNSGGVSLGHLWFLYYLLLFYAAALISRGTVRALDRNGKVLRGIDAALRFCMRTGLAALVFALPIATYLVVGWTAWPGWTGLPSPVYPVPFVPALLGYGLSFAVGWLLHRQTDLLLQLRERWVQYSLAGTVLAVASYLIAGPTPHWSAYLHGGELRIYAMTYLTASWCLSFAVIGIALRFLSNASAVRRYIADSSYWLYLMFLPPFVFFQQLQHRLGWPWGVRYAITVVATVSLSLLSYHAFVRFTFIGAILNGRRHRRTASPGGAHNAKNPEPDHAPHSSQTRSKRA